MTQPFSSLRARWPLMLACAGLIFLATSLPAEPTPGKDDSMVVKMVCQYLQRGHLKRPEINQEIARRLYKHFLKDLDPTKGYFLKSDVEEFQKYEDEIGDMLKQGDMSFAYKVYERFITRFGERIKMIEELVNAKHDFTVKEYLPTDYDSIDYLDNQKDLRERWRKRIKFDLLLHKIGQKPLSDAEARQKVLDRYHGMLKRFKQWDNYDLMELFLTDLTSSVDPHSNYMSPTTLSDFDIAMRLHLEGIGALLRSENGATIVAEIVPGGAAAKDGRLKANDKIIGVAQGDDKFQDVVDWKLTEVVKLIRGKSGTKVQLKVIPAGKIEPVAYAYTRQRIELKSQEARGDIIELDKKEDGSPYRIGIINLPSFYTDTSAAKSKGTFTSATEDVRRILKQFNGKHVDGVVLDLRHNGGGALSEALALTGLFINQGPIVQVKNAQGRIQHADDPDNGIVYGGPLLVLVSKLSASASEILAGALQDYGRALIVGDSTTHGKGTVQVVLDLAEQLQAPDSAKLGALKLTIQQFYRVNGDSTQNHGVDSDVVIPSLTDAVAGGEKDLDHPLDFDHVPPIEHEDMNLISPQVKQLLQKRSSARVKQSPEFGKLLKEIAVLKARKERKTIPLNEQELKTDYDQDAIDKVEKGTDELSNPDGKLNESYKFPRTFTNNEVLKIMEDYLQGKKLVQAAR
jgi:carboxyl-terminal processing protease